LLALNLDLLMVVVSMPKLDLVSLCLNLLQGGQRPILHRVQVNLLMQLQLSLFLIKLLLQQFIKWFLYSGDFKELVTALLF
jgi:hypothetical protein